MVLHLICHARLSKIQLSIFWIFEEKLPWQFLSMPKQVIQSPLSNKAKDMFVDWQGHPGDVASHEDFSNLKGFSKQPLLELGIYDKDECLDTWTFEELYANEQWNENEMTLVSDTSKFIEPKQGYTCLDPRFISK